MHFGVEAGKIKNYTVAGNDLVITIVGANIGDVGFVNNEYNGANLTENAARIRVNEELCEPRFLSFQLSTPRAKEKFQLLTGGSAQGKFGLYKVNAFDVVLPPVRVQKPITTIISTYDDFIENNRRRTQLLEQATRLLYKKWFVHLRFPGHEHVKIKDSVPEGWERLMLGKIVHTNEKSYKVKSQPAEFNYVDISYVKPGRILPKTAMLSSEALGRARRKAKDGDVILSNVRPNLRAYALVLEPGVTGVFSTGFTVLSGERVSFTWLYLFTTSDSFVGHLVNLATGAGYPAVARTISSEQRS